jgi:hypothetical protein
MGPKRLVWCAALSPGRGVRHRHPTRDLGAANTRPDVARPDRSEERARIGSLDAGPRLSLMDMKLRIR